MIPFSLTTKLIALGLLLTALIGTGWRIHHNIYQSGFDDSKTISDKERSLERAAAVFALEEANAGNRARERALTMQLSETSTKAAKDQENANVKINALRGAVRAGDLRLSIAIRKPADHCPASGENPAAAGESGDETRGELVPEAAETLIDIAADGDRAVRQLNGCIDAYSAVSGTP